MMSGVLWFTALVLVGQSAEADARLEVRGSLEWITAARVLEPRGTPLNPQNLALELPRLSASSELRPNLKVEQGSVLSLVLRPRMWGDIDWVEERNEWQRARGDGSAEWTEVYLTWRPSELTAVTYGRQNFQWGPGELTSPTNRLFQQSQLLRDPLYLVRGRELLRVNVSPHQRVSAVLLAELREADVRSALEPAFRPQALLKLELAHDASYVGVVASTDTVGRATVGEYAQLVLRDALFLYVDASHSASTSALYPVATPFGPVLARSHRAPSGPFFTQALAGARYAFEGGEDVRVEALWNEPGYSRADLRDAFAAARANPLVLPAFAAPGLELIGRALLYAAVRLPELPPHDELTVELRYAHSLTDSSGAAFVTSSWAARDDLVAFLSVNLVQGPRYGEFSRFARGGATAGVVVTW